MGEPFVSQFEPAEMEAHLRRSGFEHVTDFGPSEAIETYFRGRADVRFGGSQRLAIARR